MGLAQFTKKMAECFNHTDTSVFDTTTEFKNLEEWGSMMALIVIAMIDADYNKTITAEELKRANTVSDLFDIVQAQ